MSTQVGFYEAWRDLMRSWGFTVHEAAGWRTRDAAPRAGYAPGKLYIEHHDASSKLSGNWGALNYILNNRLANIVTARDGQIMLCAAGPQNHAGVGSRNSLGDVPANQANWNSLGNEVANSGSEAYDPRCTRAIIATERAWAIVSGREGQWNRIIGHKEWADPAGRKTDPRVDMDQRRRDVAAFNPAPQPPPLKHPVFGAIHEAFLRNGGLDRMGQPVGPEQKSLSTPGGLWQNFEKEGRIFWHPDIHGGAYAVMNPIEPKFREGGAEGPGIGFPTSDVHPTADGVGRFQHFVFGSIFHHPDTGTFVVRGQIRDRWASLGWELGFGYPLTDELVNPDTVGRRTNFAGNRSIYFFPGIGAQPVSGVIWEAWGAAGWEQGAWGYPTSGETGGAQTFQGGTAVIRDGQVVFTPKDAPQGEPPVVEPAPPVVAPPAKDDTVLGLPVPADSDWRVSSKFGPRNGVPHRGIDIATPAGTPLLAMEDGVVTTARVSGTPTSGFGFVIVVRHEVGGQIVDTVQGHMRPESCRVKVGDKVTRGQQLAEVGSYGDSSGPHTHAEVCIGGWYAPGSEWVDPAPWLGL